MNRAGRRARGKWLRQVRIVGRGGFVRAEVEGRARGKVSWVRGRIHGFSSAARRRLMERLACMPAEDFVGALWVTLTYVRNMDDWQRSERDLEVLWRRMCARFGDVALVWVRQRQKRGAIHYHLIVLGVHWVSKEWLAEAWADITDDQRPFTRVERLYSRKRAGMYCARYMVKEDTVPPGGPGGGAAEAAARPGSQSLGLTDVSYSVGRCWGVKGRQHLSEQITVIGQGELTPEALRGLRSAGRAIWPGVGRMNGFGLYVPNGCLQAEKFCAIVGLCVEVSGSAEVVVEYERGGEELELAEAYDAVA